MSAAAARADAADPAAERHAKLLRFLAVRLEGLREITPLMLLRGLALAGYNANPDPNVSGADPGSKAIWADADAEALLGVPSDDDPEQG